MEPSGIKEKRKERENVAKQLKLGKLLNWKFIQKPYNNRGQEMTKALKKRNNKLFELRDDLCSVRFLTTRILHNHFH